MLACLPGRFGKRERLALQNAAAPNFFPVPFYDRLNVARLVGELWPRVDLLDGPGEILPGVRAVTAPCRVSLVDAPAGDTVVLFPYEHQPAAGSPYRSSGAIFVRRDARQARPAVNEVPTSVRSRLLSVRAYDAEEMMIDADVLAGQVLEEAIGRFFADPQVAYLHLHNARLGYYHCRVGRA